MNFTIAALMGAAVVTASEGGPYSGPSYGRRGSYGPASYGRGPAPYGRGPAPYGRGPAPYSGPPKAPLGPKAPFGQGYGKLPGFAYKKAAPVKKVYKSDPYSSASESDYYSSDDNKSYNPYGRKSSYGGPSRRGPYAGPSPNSYFGPGRLGLGKKAYTADPYSSASDSDYDHKKVPTYGAKSYGGPAYGRAPYGRGPAPYGAPKKAYKKAVYSSSSASESDYDYNVAPKSPFGGKPAYAGPGPYGPYSRGPYAGPGPLPYGKAPVKKVSYKAPVKKVSYKAPAPYGGYASSTPGYKLPAYGGKGPIPAYSPKSYGVRGSYGHLNGHRGHRVSHSVVPYDPHALKVSNKADLGPAPYGLGIRGPANGPGNKGAYVMDQQPKGYGPNKNGTYNLNNNAALEGTRALNTKPDPRGIKDVRGFGGLNSNKGNVKGVLGKGFGGADLKGYPGFNFAAHENFKKNKTFTSSPFPSGFSFKPSSVTNNKLSLGSCDYDGPCAFGGVTKKIQHKGLGYGAPKAPTSFGRYGLAAGKGYGRYGPAAGKGYGTSLKGLAYGAPAVQKLTNPYFKKNGAFGNYGSAFNKPVNQKPAYTQVVKPEIKKANSAWAGPAWPTQDPKNAGNPFYPGA